MQNSPPEFKHSTKCQACGSPFGLINRKHHCRNCGNTFCGKCSAKNAPIPTYGFVDPVRVCDKCYDDLRATLGFGEITSRTEIQSEERGSSETPAAEPKPKSAQQEETQEVSGSSDEKETDGAKPAAPKKKVKNCKCNMPLCVCPPDPETEEEKEERKKLEGTKKKAVEKKAVEKPSSPGKTYPAGFQSNFMGFGQKPQRQYDLKADLNNQCREAVKALDVDGVRLLLKAGAKADYKDRTGNTLLHLAAMFDNTELVKVLITAGADPYAKNPDKESPIDIAPPALAMKMKQLVPPKEGSAAPTTQQSSAPATAPSPGASTFDEPEPDRPRPVPVAESTPASDD